MILEKQYKNKIFCISKNTCFGFGILWDTGVIGLMVGCFIISIELKGSK